MTGFLEFVADSKVHDTVLVTMVISSFLAALPKPGHGGFSWADLYKFIYDWMVGFWSMKTGQPLPDIHIQSSQQTPTSLTTQDVTIPTNPTAPEAPAKTS